MLGLIHTEQDLKEQLHGKLLRPGDSGYDEARTIWNAMIDRRPASIVQCSNADDVPPAIAFAREHGLEISIRGGGHNIAGNAVCDGGLMIDFSKMREVRVDPAKKRAHVQPGATLHDFDQSTQEYNLATPLGINSTTGIAGLTLGGGFGWLTRMYGMTIDNLLSAELITAEGEKRKASESENPDLFWAIRGGGGNFGVVTDFEFQLHEMPPQVLAGLIFFPVSQARQVMEQYRDFCESAPEELTCWMVLREAPPLPFLPREVHGTKVIILAVIYVGDIEQGRHAIAPLTEFGDACGTHIGPCRYVDWQQAFDFLSTPGARNYWKSHNFTKLSDGFFDVLLEFGKDLPSPQCEIFVGHIAGAANRVPPAATAWNHRDARFVMNVHGRWNEATGDTPCIAWSRALFKAAAPFASAGAYVNFMTNEETSRIAAAYGPHYERLVQFKRKWDPENIFHLNQNIKP